MGATQRPVYFELRARWRSSLNIASQTFVLGAVKSWALWLQHVTIDQWQRLSLPGLSCICILEYGAEFCTFFTKIYVSYLALATSIKLLSGSMSWSRDGVYVYQPLPTYQPKCDQHSPTMGSGVCRNEAQMGVRSNKRHSHMRMMHMNIGGLLFF